MDLQRAHECVLYYLDDAERFKPYRQRPLPPCSATEWVDGCSVKFTFADHEIEINQIGTVKARRTPRDDRSARVDIVLAVAVHVTTQAQWPPERWLYYVDGGSPRNYVIERGIISWDGQWM